ncbi:carbohydrate kinase family protein [Inhella gelatinilytica]|uniref:Carbohydrate kinase n=1 Tax=Inhella gelatinilytica TaxID=2795030 RepID=A0A931NEK8_9BURK|nr:carbohydrate kinase [Inhella gelatinilytica]MBH9552621.1 carbohydrate kinase [Inhella gelatinilytica]
MSPQFISFGEALTDLVTTGGQGFQALPGGAGWNVARACAALGLRSAWAGCLSLDSFGDALWQASEQAGLDTRFIRRVEAAPLLAVVDQLDPPNYFFIGASAADLAFDPTALPALTGLQWAQFGGISLVREPLGTRLEAWADQLKQQGVRLAFDPNHRALMGAQDLPRLLRFIERADVIKLSDEDLRGYFPHDDPSLALQRLRARNPQATWLYTRGADGATLLSPAVELHAPAWPVRVVDTVGAGDASLAGLLRALVDGEPPARQLAFAVANAALACAGVGAVAPSRAQLEAALCGR